MGTLWIVATPIGHVDDISLRAIEVLKTVDGILAEDTRHSGRLMARLGITTQLKACDQHKESQVAVWLERHLAQGKSWAYISDAGTPGISDPGGRLAEHVTEAGHIVRVVPGPSAVTAAIMGAGLVAQPFLFVGFLPRKQGKIERLLTQYASLDVTIIFYEAANRLEKTLTLCESAFLGRRVVVGRELTKMHETFHRGRIGEPLKPAFVDKGEVVVMIEGGVELHVQSDVQPMKRILSDANLTKKDKIKRLKEQHQFSRNEAYDLVEWWRSEETP